MGRANLPVATKSLFRFSLEPRTKHLPRGAGSRICGQPGRRKQNLWKGWLQGLADHYSLQLEATLEVEEHTQKALGHTAHHTHTCGLCGVPVVSELSTERTPFSHRGSWQEGFARHLGTLPVHFQVKQSAIRILKPPSSAIGRN